MIPGAAFAALLEEGKAQADAGAVNDCGSPDNCIEAEITPEEHFFENTYFPKSLGVSPLVGKPICAYGTWVGERLHGYRPEIHPSELIWWREPVDGAEHHFLLVVQDDSNRFDRPRDFAGSKPPAWKPWAVPPRSVAFRIALQWKLQQPAQTHFVRLLGRNIVTAADDGGEHLLEYEGRPVMRIVEEQGREPDVAVSFTEPCRDPASQSLRNFAEFQLGVGVGDRDGKEGYALVRVGASSDPLPETLAPAFRSVARSPRAVISGGRRRLVVDVELKPVGDAPPSDLRIRSLKMRSGDVLRPTAAPGRPTVIQGLPVEPGRLVSVELASGREVSVEMPGVGVAPLVMRQAPALSAADPAAWGSVVRGLRARGPAMEAPLSGTLTIRRAPTWSVSTRLEYAPLRDGEVTPEDDSSLSRSLNDVLRGGQGRRVNLFGTQRPFRTKWSFEATDVATGEQVLVVVGPSPGVTGNRVHVRILEEAPSDAALRVTFPETPSRVYRLLVKATMVDPFGHRGTLEHEIWSHVLTAGDPRALAAGLISTAAGVAAAPREEADRLSNLGVREDDFEAQQDSARRRARLLRLTAERAAEENQATIGDLERLVRVAALLRAR